MGVMGYYSKMNMLNTSKSNNIKNTINTLITDYVRNYHLKNDIATKWGTPLVGYANANHPYIQNLPKLISASHDLPQNILDNPKIILVYYIPFTKELARTNRNEQQLSSPDWARAYEETNKMFTKLNSYLIQVLSEYGYNAATSSKASTYDRLNLISDWSYRHLAYVAGLGTFGLNNMLITKYGCCGRYNAIVTNLDIEADRPLTTELCLFKKNGTCGVCITKCPAKALKINDTGELTYDRKKCYAVLRKNAEIYNQFGSSYTSDMPTLSSTTSNVGGSEVCGKCITHSPCAFW